jgi:hypothetical protein
MAYDLWFWFVCSPCNGSSVMTPQFDFNIRVDGESLFVYPLEENQLVYVAQTLGLSKFNVCFDWYKVTENWVLRAHTHGFRFCRSF